MASLTLKNVSAQLLKSLKARAKAHHRSMQGEVLDILESNVSRAGKLSVAEVAARIRKMGISSPSESAQIVREMRDAR